MEIKKITEDEVRALWVQRLSDTPNRGTRFGGEGLSAAEVKAVYDALPLCLVARFNALLDALMAGEFSGTLPLYGQKTLKDLPSEISSGGLAEMLTINGRRSLIELALAFDEHDHDNYYARIGPNGKLLPELLPNGGEGAYAKAEAAREVAEAARVAAEAERGKRLDEIAHDMAALEEREDEREMREGERAAALSAHAERLDLLVADASIAAAHTSAIQARLENLEAAAIGTTHIFFDDTTPVYRKEVPNGVLPYAAISLIGGATTASGCVPVTAVSSYGASVLPYPYPASRAGETTTAGVTIRQMEDGSLILNGTAEKNVSHFLYTEHDGLSFPSEGVYIDGLLAEGITLNVKCGTSGDVWKTGRFTPSPSDEFYDRYVVYIYIPKGSVLNNLRVVPSITRGLTARTGVAYRAPQRIEIPQEVQALPGYGRYDNLLDLEAGLYRQRRSEDGYPLNEEVTYPLPAPLDAPLYLRCDAGGYLLFESKTGAPVESSVTYAKRVGQ